MTIAPRLHRIAIGLTFVTALAFALLAGLHGARPITPPALQTVLAFDPGALCGDGVLQSHCPACALSVVAVLPEQPQLLVRPASRSETLVRLHTNLGQVAPQHRPHQPRAPPILL